MENKERQETIDPRKNKYVIHVRRDTNMMKKFVKFTYRVKHPRVSMNMFILGALLVALPIYNKEIALTGRIISYVMGVLLLAMALFRHYISVSMMKKNPEVKENEELTYLFGNTGVRVEQDGTVENMGYYKTIYRVWEDEKTFYVGLNEEDLLILPKNRFEEGDPGSFREFVLEKSGADFTWQPTGFVNICKDKWMKMQMKMAAVGMSDSEDDKK